MENRKKGAPAKNAGGRRVYFPRDFSSETEPAQWGSKQKNTPPEGKIPAGLVDCRERAVCGSSPQPSGPA